MLPELTILDNENIWESQGETTVVLNGKKVACQLPNYHFWRLHNGILVSEGYSIFQKMVSGIFPCPNPGSDEKQFHMRIIPYEIIPHEGFNCTYSLMAKHHQLITSLPCTSTINVSAS